MQLDWWKKEVKNRKKEECDLVTKFEHLKETDYRIVLFSDIDIISSWAYERQIRSDGDKKNKSNKKFKTTWLG